MLKRMLPASVLLASSLGWAQTAHAKGGLVMDLIGLGQNVLNGTIPPIYSAAFGLLVLLIVILGIKEARKNARAAEQNPDGVPGSASNSITSGTAPVDLGKKR